MRRPESMLSFVRWRSGLGLGGLGILHGSAPNAKYDSPSLSPSVCAIDSPYLASFLAPTKLADLQIAALTATYLQEASLLKPAWIVVGQALRVALDLGAHREKTYKLDSRLDNEMWKRNFW